MGHRAPLFKVPAPYIMCSDRDILSSDYERLLVFTGDHCGTPNAGSILSEYEQLFGLASFLESHPRDEYIYLFQYRKFLSLRQPATRSVNQGYAFVATPTVAPSLFPLHSEFSKIHGGSVLIGPGIQVFSLADNYSKCHHVEDFVAFTLSLALGAGFDERRLRSFIDCKVLLPVPSLGVTTVGFFRDTVQVLKAAWQHFARGYLRPRNGYQRRVGGFLLERLHSFLLYEYVTSGRVIVASGSQVVVSDTPLISLTK